MLFLYLSVFPPLGAAEAEGPPWGRARAEMVLVPFAETKGTRRVGATPHIKTFHPFTRKLICHFEQNEKSPPIAEREISPMGRNDKRGVMVTEGNTWIPD